MNCPVDTRRSMARSMRRHHLRHRMQRRTRRGSTVIPIPVFVFRIINSRFPEYSALSAAQYETTPGSIPFSGSVAKGAVMQAQDEVLRLLGDECA